MKGFLDEVAADLYARYGAGISELTILFPSQRARVFFLDALSRVAERPLWRPEWMTIDELTAEASGLRAGDDVRMVTELYKIYSEYHPEPFDRFYFWGETLLRDFDTVDKYLIDADRLFRNISDLKELEADLSYLTPEQVRILRSFWAELLGDGDLSARTDLRGEDEVARLGETFDAMAESVEKDRDLERRLTTDVAHELRTPLMAIQATVEAMVDGVYEADEERLVTVNSEIQRLSRLVNALLKLSRLENRADPMKEEVVNVGELIAGIIATHEMFVSDSGLTMEYDAQPDVMVVGDADMIRQATANLISNAVRYTPEGGHITVAVRKGDIMASIAVKDTGIGLTKEEARMVFSRFWRADAGRNRESGGLGVGLAVVKEIVDRHGGWVQVEGEKDKGACFTIHIPLYDEDAEKHRAFGSGKKRSSHKKQPKAVK